MKVEFERLSVLRENQTKFRFCDYTQLCELLPDASMGINEAQAWTEKRGGGQLGDIRKLIVLLSRHFSSKRYMRQKTHDIIIAISNSIGNPDVFLTMTCNSKWPEILDSLVPGQNHTDRPD